MGTQPRKSKLVHGVGINDVDYSVVTYGMVDGKYKQLSMCPFYSRWKDVLRRTHSEGYFKYRDSYRNVSLQESWKYFSNFKLWMEDQEWEGLSLDKDILSGSNKIYSESTCAFVPLYVNNLLLNNLSKRGEDPLGVSFQNRTRIKNSLNPYRAQVNIFGKRTPLGDFPTRELAHKAWQSAKADYIEEVVTKYASESCFRTDVAGALIKRAWNLRLDVLNNIETKVL